MLIKSSLPLCLVVQGQDPQQLPQLKWQGKGKKANGQAGITPQPLLAPVSLFDDDVQQEILMWVLQDK